MSSKSYYDRYWSNEYKPDQNGHVNQRPEGDYQSVKQIYEFISPYLGINILDFGAGEGHLSDLIKQKVKAKVISADISSNARSLALKKYPNLDYTIIKPDEELPFKSKSFDTVLLIDVIEHVYDIDHLLKEINRVLDKNGEVIIVTPDYNFLKRIIIGTFFWNKVFYPLNPHIRFFTRKSLKTVMQKHSFMEINYKWGLSWFKIMPQNMYTVYQKMNQ